jgi:hypothetical protein
MKAQKFEIAALKTLSRLNARKLLLDFLEKNAENIKVKFRGTEKRYRDHQRKIAFELTDRERKVRRENIVVNEIRTELRKIKKTLTDYHKRIVAVVVVFAFLFSSCATLLTPKANEHQKHKPGCDEHKREIRIGYLIADIVLCPVIGLILDFSTKKIYKPIPSEEIKVCEGGSHE